MSKVNKPKVTKKTTKPTKKPVNEVRAKADKKSDAKADKKSDAKVDVDVDSLTKSMAKLKISTVYTNRRKLCEYPKEERAIIDASADCINSQIKKLAAKGYSIHDNQKKAAAEIVSNFADSKVLIQLALGKTQSGKTGLILSTIQQFIAKYPIHSENIYIITGMSSKNWLDQTKERIPGELEKNIYHRDTLKKFATDVAGKKNILVMIDEVHMACLMDQTIHKAFESANFLDLQYMFDNDIKIIDISATPNGVWWNVEKWNAYSKMVFMDPGKGYVSAGDLLRMGKLKEYRMLCDKPTTGKNVKKKTDGKDSKVNGKLDDIDILDDPMDISIDSSISPNITSKISIKTKTNIKANTNTKAKPVSAISELKSTIDSFDSACYHIIRTETGSQQDKVIKSLQKVMPESKYSYITFDLNSEVADINKILEKQPEQHTIILLKEMLRCAKSINKKYIGVLYERFSKRVDNSVIIQGLLGRLTGYDYNGKSICFTHLESVELYETCWNSKFTDVSSWSSGSTSNKKGVVSAKDTFSSTKLVTGMEEEKSVEKPNKIKTVSKTFDTFDECKEYVLQNEWKVPTRKKANASGYYVYKIGKESKIHTVNEAKKYATNSLINNEASADSNYRHCIGYGDIKDATTVKHIIVHK